MGPEIGCNYRENMYYFKKIVDFGSVFDILDIRHTKRAH